MRFSYTTDFPNDMFEALTEYFKTEKLQRVGFDTEGEVFNLIFYNYKVYFEHVREFRNNYKKMVCGDIFKFANKVTAEIEGNIEGWVDFKMPSDPIVHEKRIRENISKLKSAIKVSKVKEERCDSEKQYFKDMIESKKEIHLDCDYVLNDDMYNSPTIEIGDGTVIDGHGHSIYGCDGNVFVITGDGVVLKNISFKNSRIALYVNSSNGSVEISDCRFINNNYNDGGSAIINNSGLVKVKRCDFIENHSIQMGTAIKNSGNLILSDCHFENNSPEKLDFIIHNIVIHNQKTANLTLENADFNEVNDKPIILNSGHMNFKDKALENMITEIQNPFNHEGKPKPRNWPYPPSKNAKPFEYLKKLIEQDKEIKLDFDIENADSSKAIILNTEGMTIDGQGHTINACKQSGIFEIEANDICLKNINFENGIPAILNKKSENLKIINCTFQKNERAISSPKEATVTNCKFKSNSEIQGGAIIGPNKLINCEFEDNFAINGGAISGGKHIVNCKFTNNNAKWGGAIDPTSKLEIENCTFIGNTATIGGAILYDGNAIKIRNSLFKNNEAKTHGGAISTTEYSFGEIENCEFDSNESHFGGAILNKSNGKAYDFFPIDYELLIIRECTFKNNKGKYDSAICNDAMLEISKTSFEDEKPIINREPEAELTLKECDIDENDVETFKLKYSK